MKKDMHYRIMTGAAGREDISSFRQTPYCFPAYELNPAVGCDYGCIYCSMYAQEGRMQHRPVKIYSDYPEYLESVIREMGDDGKVFNFTPKSDALSPSMVDSGITSEILDVLARNKRHFYILTKSGIPDDGIMERLSAMRDLCQIVISSGLPDERYRSVLEPDAPSISDRMEFAALCRKQGISVSGIIAPYMPRLNGSYSKDIIERFCESGVKHTSIQLLKLSEECLENLCRAMPDYEDILRDIYDKKECNSVEWSLPQGKTVKRYFARADVIKDELSKLKQTAASNGMTVSTCRQVMELMDDMGYNSEAARKGIFCVGIKGPMKIGSSEEVR